MALSGRSLLSEALSPSGRDILNEFFETNSGSRSTRISPAHYTFQTLPLLTEVTCHSRDICDLLSLTVNIHGHAIVSKVFPKKSHLSPVVDMENLGLIRKDDVLVSINKYPVSEIDEAQEWLMEMPLPLTLVFSRVVVRKNTLGEYSLDDLQRHVEHNRSRLLERYSPLDVAQMLRMMIQFTEAEGSYRLLKDFILEAEAFFMPKSMPPITETFETVKRYIQYMHNFMASEDETKRKRWIEEKHTRSKRLEAMQKQLKVLEAKLTSAAAAQGSSKVSHEYLDLRSLVDQLRLDVEQSKQLHYLPPCEGFTLRFGTGGVYAGVGDVWISSYHTSFSIETQRSAPQVLLRLTPLSDTGLKVRASNFKVYSEGRMLVPTFHVDEINIEVQFSADIPLEYDPIRGWRVQGNAMNIHFASLKYYERQSQSNVKGKSHDSVMKTFLNRIVPSVVEEAVTTFLCAEVGALLLDGRAKVRLSGDLHVEGRNLAVFDAPLGSEGSAEESTEARQLVGCSAADGDVLFKLYKLFVAKQTIFKKDSQLPHLSIRELVDYGIRMRQSPAVRALLGACWQLAVDVLTTDEGCLDFGTLMSKVEHMETYPVDVSLSFHSTNIRVDLCEAAAAAYTAMERILRQKMTTRNEIKVELEEKLQELEETYNQTNLFLSTIASRVDEMVVLVSGGLPAGFDSKLSFEATELSCKGPWQASFDIPMTDLNKPQSVAPKTTTATTRTVVSHDKDDLVVSQFISTPGTDTEEEIQIRLQDAAYRVLLDIPEEVAMSGQRLEAMEFKLQTSGEPPNLSLNMGNFAKCAITCKKMALCSPMWTVLKLLGDALAVKSPVLMDYLRSPYFSFSLNLFTSLQVTPEQMYWTLNSASLSESVLSYVTHRICISQVLRDMGKKNEQPQTDEVDEQAFKAKQSLNRSQSIPCDSIETTRPGLARQNTFFGDDDPRRKMFQLNEGIDEEPHEEPRVDLSPGKDDSASDEQFLF